MTSFFSFAQETSESPTEWRAGAASAKITPDAPMAMSGYAGRKNKPSEGTEQDLFAKALAIEDRDGNRVVILTSDLIGIVSTLRERVEAAVEEKHGIPGRSLLMNASHTHCGPAYMRDAAEDYFETLVGKMVDVIGEALDSMEPSELTYSFARAGFAMNRRTPTEGGYRNHPNPQGVVDHSVPVLAVRGADESLRAVVFGYACHNTTMGFMKWLGDYAGYAQEYLEADHPGTVAMFMTGCGGDQNPYPRSMLLFAQKHGRSLATAVDAALETNQNVTLHQRRLEGPLRTTLETVELEFATDRENYDYPIQVIQFGPDLYLIALAGEVVVDYSLRLKRELGESGSAIWVAGYSNDYNGYVPSRRVLEEGGYEAKSRPWKPEIEERVVEKTHRLFEAVNATAAE
ncbi:MAG: neutral/alkaline non-lysosomal ceramidase N-terminal domain-containing protein [Verrucomicrobiales bacterium]